MKTLLSYEAGGPETLKLVDAPDPVAGVRAGLRRDAAALEATPESLARPGEMLPDSALICSCNGVTKGALCAAIDAGSQSLGALKKATKAATSCGGCAPMTKQVLDAEFLAAMHAREHNVPLAQVPLKHDLGLRALVLLSDAPNRRLFQQI